MKTYYLIAGIAIVMLAACSKSAIITTDGEGNAVVNENAFVRYTIIQGQQFCDKNVYTPIDKAALNFIVKFDSSAVYENLDTSNQRDINKLFGCSDNNAQHHLYSARFGWRWNDKALHLFAYVYNGGVQTNKELTTVEIGKEVNCSIKIKGNQYTFTVDGKTETMPRESTTATAIGYKLYPYFGGDEHAPHTISIWIKELN